MFDSKQTAGQSPRQKSRPIYISWYINDYGRPWTPVDVNLRSRNGTTNPLKLTSLQANGSELSPKWITYFISTTKDQARPRTNCKYWRGAACDYGEQKASSPSLSSPSVTFASRGGIMVSSLVSSVYVRLRSLVFGLMLRCRSRTLTVLGELLSRLLKTGRSAVRPRSCLPRCQHKRFEDLQGVGHARAAVVRSGDR
jgi:hypothetical protein